MSRLRHLPILLAAMLFAVAGAGAPGALAADPPGHFLSGFEDLPLMDGLTEQADSGVVFDKPDGRIVERYASGPLSRDSVMTFYRNTLPQLGWRARRAKKAHTLAFKRDDELLDIEFKKAGSELVVRFSVTPK
ncbi:MAG TPA: hypothetical protein VKA19_02300 [Alphaproteobacteria bacterium]|nr:hypothetical protein [Alphaproteobacteria bacterium]